MTSTALCRSNSLESSVRVCKISMTIAIMLLTPLFQCTFCNKKSVYVHALWCGVAWRDVAAWWGAVQCGGGCSGLGDDLCVFQHWPDATATIIVVCTFNLVFSVRASASIVAVYERLSPIPAGIWS